MNWKKKGFGNGALRNPALDRHLLKIITAKLHSLSSLSTVTVSPTHLSSLTTSML